MYYTRYICYTRRFGSYNPISRYLVAITLAELFFVNFNNGYTIGWPFGLLFQKSSNRIQASPIMRDFI